MIFSMQNLDTLKAVANLLNIEPDWLFTVIMNESSWDPKRANPAPHATAKGLIQFTDSTAKGLGYASSQDLVNKCPDIDSQLRGPVYRYLRAYMPFKDFTDFCLSIFYPAGRKNPDAPLPAKARAMNPGFKTPRDYIPHVQRSVKGLDLSWIKQDATKVATEMKSGYNTLSGKFVASVAIFIVTGLLALRYLYSA